MSTLDKYYRDLAAWEQMSSLQLVAPWNKVEVAAIKADFIQAIRASGLKTSSLPITNGTSNQSIGNKFADFFVVQVDPFLSAYKIKVCSGAGYPDKRLVANASPKTYPLELKATSDWNPNDTNRCVLTCSSAKLRRYFQSPINHLLVTICYRINSYQVNAVRLDFLEPDTQVNVRLEASVSRKILTDATHGYEKIDI